MITEKITNVAQASVTVAAASTPYAVYVKTASDLFTLLTSVGAAVILVLQLVYWRRKIKKLDLDQSPP